MPESMRAEGGRAGMSRRRFLAAASALVGVSALAACGGTTSPTPTSASTKAPAAASSAAASPAAAATSVPATIASTATTATQAPTVQPSSSAASPATSAGSPKRGGEIIIAGTGDIQFEPYSNFVPARFVYGQFFNVLADYRGPDGIQINPQLAESWTETDKTLTIKLRKGVTFSTGREFVAQDVVDNINRAKDKSIGHTLFSTFDASVDGAEAIDQYTARITYKSVYPVKLDDLTSLYIIPKEAMAQIAAKPVGTGPFVFSNYTPGDKLQMARFEQYWNKDKVYLDKATVKIIADPQARLANLLSGSVDVVDAPLPSDVARLKSEGKVQIASPPPGGAWYANVLNCGKPPFDNKLVRQAINYTVDRDKINKLAYYNLAPVTQSRYLPSSPWYNEKASNVYKYDLQKAKTLLQQAGKGDGFKTSIVVSEAVLPGSKAMAQVWIQDLDKVGIKADIIERDQTSLYDEYYKGNYEIQAYGLGDGKFDPATYLAFNSGYRVVDNKAKIETQPFFEEYKKLIADGANSIDPKVRKPIYDRLQEIIADEGWIVTTAFWLTFTALSKRVQGYRATLSPPTFEGVWLEG